MRFWLLTTSFVCSCTGPAGKQASAADTLATIGEKQLTVSEVQAQLDTQPDFIRARLAEPKHKREFVDSLVRTELLAQEARRRGLDQKPEAKALFDRLLVQQLLSQVSAEKPVTEADARAYYDSHADEFGRPERVQVAIVEIASEAEAAAERKSIAALKGAARDARFTTWVAKSLHPSRPQGGDLGPRTKEELSQQVSPELAEAAFTLNEAGALTMPVKTASGFVVAKYLGRQAANQRPFETEREQLTARLTAEQRAKAVDELVASLKAKNTVTIRDEALGRLEAKAPSGPLVPPP
jgi:peptidyl-prolyl cis-trans isomerase C